MKPSPTLFLSIILAAIGLCLASCGKPDQGTGDADGNENDDAKPTGVTIVENNDDPQPKSGGGSGDDSDDWRRITWFDIELVLDAVQSEPQGQNKDRFEALVQGITFVSHNKADEAEDLQTMCRLTITNQGRAPDSDQGDTTVAEDPSVFHVTTLWEPHNDEEFLHVVLTPMDVVEYKFKSGEVYGKGSVLEQLFKHATCEGVRGTLDSFSLPAGTEAPAEFTFKIATPRETGSWFDGTATFKILRRWTTEWDPASSEWVFIDQQGDDPPEEALKMPAPTR